MRFVCCIVVFVGVRFIFLRKITPKEHLLFVELRIAKTDRELGPVVERRQVSSSKS